MSFGNAMNTILPSINGILPHVTGNYGEIRPNGPHGGVDINYIGGQSGVNLTHPVIHSPVDGVVTYAGGKYGTIEIRDAQGNSHEILHTDSQSVRVGQNVKAGDPIGGMGGCGPKGPEHYPQHVHYQIKDSKGRPKVPQRGQYPKGVSVEFALELI